MSILDAKTRLSWRKTLAVAVPWLWLGLVLAISVEAMAKFAAPSLSYSAALDVGQYVFSALNRVEWALAGGVLLGFLALPTRRWIGVFVVVIGILGAQTLWLLPALARHAEVAITGGSLPDSQHHVFYAALEGIKILSLAHLARVALSALRS